MTLPLVMLGSYCMRMGISAAVRIPPAHANQVLILMIRDAQLEMLVDVRTNLNTIKED